MRVRARRKSRGRGILRSTLRGCLQPALRAIFRAALRKRWFGQAGQTGSGDRLELAAALPLGGFQSLGDHAVVHPEPLGHHVLP